MAGQIFLNLMTRKKTTVPEGLPMTRYQIDPKQQLRIENDFDYHPPTCDQVGRYQLLRGMARGLALEVLSVTPSSAEQTLSIRNLEMAIFWANAAIARNEGT
jgi:hypothetical protein